ncbi:MULTISPECIES: helix-turn-helix domain-containing protein [Bacillati]|uniref:Transposase IS30-like HTH domain-containing protein n=1 Tax=Arthrobacter russicus TaxID=172040 RepID=A0ABU1JBY5_9MICC|nr:helix-turn-helix domain-containing protein [Arthrobacter russicus]MDR6268907.1 hypothetical protein [Arthrobacter russicus]
MANPNPLTKQEQAQIRSMCDEGVSRNEIARRLDRSRSTITSFCSRHGIKFDGTIPEAMAKAAAINVKERQVAARERRLEIMELEDERQLRVLKGQSIWTTRVKTSGGGERWDEVTFIPADDAQRNATAAAAHTSAFKNLAPLEVEVGLQEASSMLDKVISALGVPDE